MIAGQERDRDGGGAEQEQRRDQLGRLAVFAVDRHENDGADRPGHEGQRKDHEGIEGAGQFAREREHQARKDDHRGDREDEEVEEFRGAADDDADGNLAGTSLVVAVLARVEVCHCGDLCRRHWCALNVLKTKADRPAGRQAIRFCLAQHFALQHWTNCPMSGLLRRSYPLVSRKKLILIRSARVPSQDPGAATPGGFAKRLQLRRAGTSR
ncbi:hypothetical protein ACVWZZ_003730 [Bradyrhizobium sp. LM6.10]